MALDFLVNQKEFLDFYNKQIEQNGDKMTQTCIISVQQRWLVEWNVVSTRKQYAYKDLSCQYKCLHLFQHLVGHYYLL